MAWVPECHTAECIRPSQCPGLSYDCDGECLGASLCLSGSWELSLPARGPTSRRSSLDCGTCLGLGFFFLSPCQSASPDAAPCLAPRFQPTFLVSYVPAIGTCKPWPRCSYCPFSASHPPRPPWLPSHGNRSPASSSGPACPHLRNSTSPRPSSPRCRPPDEGSHHHPSSPSVRDPLLTCLFLHSNARQGPGPLRARRQGRAGPVRARGSGVYGCARGDPALPRYSAVGGRVPRLSPES